MSKKEMGEFEERPEVKPAVAVPIERRKPTGLICSVVILAILVAGLAGYIVYDLATRSNSGDKTKCVTTSTEKGVDGEQENEQSEIADRPLTTSGYATTMGYFVVTSNGEGYISDRYLYESKKNTFKNLELLGEHGKYTFKSEEIGGHYYAPGAGESLTVEGYKLPFENVTYIQEMHFGNGNMSPYIAVISEDGKFNVVHLEIKNGDYDKAENKWHYDYEVHIKKDIKEYRGAISTQEIDVGDGIDNVVFYRNGGHEVMNYELLN